MQLETKRLLLREMTAQDLPALSAILRDEKVMYAYEHAFSDKEVQDWLDRNLERYRTDGFGLWAAVLKETGAMIGQCGITMQQIGEDKKVPEVGYLFRRDVWHQGYATEAAMACRDYAFAQLQFPHVFSIIRDNNIPSQKVARRNGMTQWGSMVKHYCGIDMPHILFRITREDWEQLP